MANPTNPSAAAQAQMLLDQDPIVKLQTLIPVLRDSISNVLQHSVYILHHSTSPESTRKNDLPLQVQRFVKLLEDFHNICDQIQMWLSLAVSTLEQTKLSQHFTPEVVGGITSSSTSAQDPNQRVIDYTEYLNTIKNQVSTAKKVQDMLTHFSQQLGRHKC